MVATTWAVPPFLMVHLILELSAVVLALFPGALRYKHRYLLYDEATVIRVITVTTITNNNVHDIVHAYAPMELPGPLARQPYHY